jgi:hypothetical protein
MKRLILCALILLCWGASSVYGMPITDPSQLSPNPTIIDFEDVNTGGNLVTILPNPVTFGDVTFTSLTGELSIFDISLAGWQTEPRWHQKRYFLVGSLIQPSPSRLRIL